MNSKLNKLSWAATLLLTMSSMVVGGTLAAQANASTKAYPDSFIKEYMKKCIRQSVAEGLPGEDAQKVCSCTINRFQARYTLTDFKTITARAEAGNGAATEALREVGYACFDDILYDDK